VGIFSLYVLLFIFYHLKLFLCCFGFKGLLVHHKFFKRPALLSFSEEAVNMKMDKLRNPKIVALIVALIVVPCVAGGVIAAGNQTSSVVNQAVGDESVTPPTSEPINQPTINVTYATNELDAESKIYTQYNFNITINNASLHYVSDAVNAAMAPLAEKYGLVKATYNIETARWCASQIIDNQGTFSVFYNGTFSDTTLSNLAVDIQNALMPMLKQA